MTKISDANLSRIMDAERNMLQGVLDGSIKNVNLSSGWGIHEEEIFLTCNKQVFETWLLENYLLREYESNPQSAEFFIDLVKFEFVCLRADNGKYRYSFVITEQSNNPQIREQLLGAARNTFEASEGKAAQVGAEKAKTQEPNGAAVEVLSEETRALNRLAELWVAYNQNQRISKNDDMKWFIGENAKAVGLSYVTVNEFKRHLPKAYKAGIIDKDKKTGRFIPRLGT